MILLIPQDEQLAALMDRASVALEKAGITAEDFLSNLPATRDEVATAACGEGFLQDLERRYGPTHDIEPTP